MATVCEHLGSSTVVNLTNNLVGDMKCNNCQTRDEVLRSLHKMTPSDLACPTCGNEREMNLVYKIEGHEDWIDRPMADLGIPALAILFAYNGDEAAYFELSGDAPKGDFWDAGSRVA